MTAAFSLGLGALLVALLFALSWAWARRVDNYSLVDAVWAFGIGIVGVLWLVVGTGDPLKRLLAAGLLALWSLRLGGHLQARIRRHHPSEDARYAALRHAWHGREASAFFWFFQGQGLSVLLLALPFLAIAAGASAPWRAWEIAGLAVTLIGIFGEALADRQMNQFKASNSAATAVCRSGLWRYSRHPNYFFEAVIWLGFYLFACGSGWGWATLHAPAIIVFLLLKVTGIPPTEASAVARKGDAYRAYQRSTSSFIPLPPRSENDPQP
jgi:steroid 5-alpha reductase family enzyme